MRFNAQLITYLPKQFGDQKTSQLLLQQTTERYCFMTWFTINLQMKYACTEEKSSLSNWLTTIPCWWLAQKTATQSWFTQRHLKQSVNSTMESHVVQQQSALFLTATSIKSSTWSWQVDRMQRMWQPQMPRKVVLKWKFTILFLGINLLRCMVTSVLFTQQAFPLMASHSPQVPRTVMCTTIECPQSTSPRNSSEDYYN